MKNSKAFKFVLPFALLLIVLTVGIIALSGNKPPQEVEPVAVVQMDVNPSISLVVDSENKVISVYGENDEGKMIINDEEIVGLQLEVAIKKIIEIESETGYLVKGNASVNKNNIRISIEAYSNNIAEDIQMNVSQTISKVCEELKIQEKLEVIKSASKEELVKRALEIDSTLTEDVANGMTHKQLIAYISGCQIEKIKIPTQQLEELYDKIKTQEINIVEKKITKQTVDNLDEAYQSLISNYDTLYNGLINAQSKLNDAYVENFIKEDSAYQVALNDYQTKKLEVLKLENEISQMDDSIEKTIQEGILKTKKLALEAQLKTIELSKTVAEEIIELLNDAIDFALQELDSFYEKMPSEIKTQVNESLSNLEEKINQTKDNLFVEFETKYKAEIEKAYANSKEYKDNLVNQLKKN